MIRIECQFCNNIIEVPASWIKTNGRVFCDSCCKSFDVELEKESSEDDDYYIDTQGF